MEQQLEVAIQLRESGKLEEARSLLLELLDQQPLDPSVWYQCAWIHDILGLESEAVPYYRKSLELGLRGEERQGALLGLGSTYRTLGMYEEAKTIFETAMKEFPDRREYQVFYAMVLYNKQAFSESMSILLKQLAETSNDEGIRSYKNAILFYSDKLDQIWD
ncbi:tetratricopeptide repeat protein [Paenibacillus sp. Marseille-P2973]|uniref:tetratricopeptide repeat protein n=1 Tax=Paenibacillus sp. Marseille-P2973 TaxID=1871032 RepID=UPI001B36FAE0|nr:tetratricopeptide repeat protein [Paenibacillus sp. Marseille-P2973]MBQ4898781.1 tetratricopeptide repeat protein [Paenibacillus sp. Marseille-P2973]